MAVASTGIEDAGAIRDGTTKEETNEEAEATERQFAEEDEAESDVPMRCELVETSHGWKLQEIGTGRLYAYVRSATPKEQDKLLAEIREEISRVGWYDVSEGGAEKAREL